jgi:cytoskeletal protein CcmA (bactofilin family)
VFPRRIIQTKDNPPRPEPAPAAPSYTPVAPVAPAPAPAPAPSYDQRTTTESEFRRSNYMTNSPKNILSSDVEIKGSLKFSNDLVIDGRIEGEVTSDGSLTVGENARIKGEIKTKSCIVFGKVEGNITVTDRCELKQSAELAGDVRAKTLSIEEGAAFMGKSIVGAAAAAGQKPANAGSPAAPVPAPAKPEVATAKVGA